MASINSVQDDEVRFITGVTSIGTLAAQSFWTWNYDVPATYDPTNNYTAKFGYEVIGGGAAITYGFDPASNWTAVERSAFAATAALWSAVANVTFTQAQPALADVRITRSSDGAASGGQHSYYPGTTGTTTIGVAVDGGIDIDTSVAAFGPIGTALSNYGGYPYSTLIHEWGHVLGLGHGGPYDEGLDGSVTAYTSYDTNAWTIMSYNEANDYGDYIWGSSPGDNGGTYRNSPTTWMPLDIVAIQRMYGEAIVTPLSGGQVFGFNSNITGPIAKFFDFTQNTRPVITLWDKGLNNTLDLSRFSSGSHVDLHDGAFSSAAGMLNNIAIAYGTHIDTVVTGNGPDIITANDNGDVVMAGSGADSITGGAGNDHLYGAGSVGISGDGADVINAGNGSDYLQGNAGNDILDGGAGSDRIQGGQGNDTVTGGNDNDTVNGNLGDDSIDGGAGNDSLRGGQGADKIAGGAGEDLLQGDLGADTLTGGAGIDVLTGGGDADLFNFAAGDARFTITVPTDAITDFTDGVDHIHLSFGVPGQILYGSTFASLGDAAVAAQQMLNAHASSSIAALKVGSDTYIFYDLGPSAPLEAIKLLGVGDPAAISAADFVAAI